MGVKHYIIPEGNNHIAGHHLAPVFSDRMRFRFMLEENCRYVPESEHDWNKLTGYSCNVLPVEAPAGKVADYEFLNVPYCLGHHINSVRIGWRQALITGITPPMNNTRCYELALYLYEDHNRLILPIPGEAFEYGTWYYGEVKAIAGRLFCYFGKDATNQYELRLQTTTTTHFDTIGYRLYPYFGGHNDKLGRDTPAPHRMDIHLEHL